MYFDSITSSSSPTSGAQVPLPVGAGTRAGQSMAEARVAAPKRSEIIDDHIFTGLVANHNISSDVQKKRTEVVEI